MPANEIFASRRGIIIPRRCPQHPPFSIAVRIERQQFLAVPHPEPPNRSVVKSCDCYFVIPTDINSPRWSRRVCPLFLSEEIVGTNVIPGTKYERFLIRCNGKTFTFFIRKKRKFRRIQHRRRATSPIGDPQRVRGGNW